MDLEDICFVEGHVPRRTTKADGMSPRIKTVCSRCGYPCVSEAVGKAIMSGLATATRWPQHKR